MGTQIDLRDDAATVEKLAKNKQKPITQDAGEKLARELRAVKYVECSALTQVGTHQVCLVCGGAECVGRLQGIGWYRCSPRILRGFQ